LPDQPRDLSEVADGVHVLEVGGGILRSNVYFVRSDSGWVLIDTGQAGGEEPIRRAARRLFEGSGPPAAILLTHIHPDHSGAAPGLARAWDCPVYVHPDELPLATADASTYFSTYQGYSAGPRRWRPPALDRWLLLPLMRLMPRARRDTLLDGQSLRDRARALGAGAAVPALPGWEAVPTPGHTPGHVAYFRRSDGLLIAGDAVVTVELNSVPGLLLWAFGRRQLRLSGPPWYFTWDRHVSLESVTTIARLRPAIVAPGHGPPRAGAEVAEELQGLARVTVASS
jgi:glyoxylase-like metal-dependent hydrolase (beta-lactamase superfamily II)